ncbi:MAG: hypothetical protein ACRD3S_08125, partial [Terracidiphilus sp.]
MASVLTAPSAEASVNVGPDPVSAPESTSVSARPQHTVAARDQVRMGRAVATAHGFSWPMLFIIGMFHVGALAALFFFSWPRLLITVVLYVLAINVGIGMCYHR